MIEIKSRNRKSRIRKHAFTFNLFTGSCLILWLCVSAVNLTAQTGGSFDLSHSVIASGGGSNSSGSAGGQTFKVEGTAGQNLAGAVSTGPNGQAGQFILQGGFWAFQPAAPTAAMVSIGGRVSTESGHAIYNARVYLTDSSGAIRAAISNGFGYYRIDGVEIGQTYIVTVASKAYQFTPQVVTVNDEIRDLDLIALP